MSPALEQLLTEICNGDNEAWEFCCHWINQCHFIDDIIDNPKTKPEEVIKTIMAAGDLVLHPFFQKNKEKLYPLRVLIANAYTDSVLFERSKFPEDKQIGDILRFCGNEMLLMIAAITTKEDQNVWERLRSISPSLRRLSFKEHHTVEGQPI